MSTHDFQNILLELDHKDLVGILKSDQRFSEQDFPNYTIDQMGDHFLPETIDGAVFNYAVRPKYWEQLKQEFKKLLCTSDKKYSSLRKDLSEGTKTIVSSIAAVMATQFGVVAGVLMPFCALLLIAALKLGKEAFCACTQLDIHIE